MLRRLRDLESWTIVSPADESIGSVDDFYFDDQHWTVRYLVAGTGDWLIVNPVLISPTAVRSLDVMRTQVQVGLTRDQVRNAPSADANSAISRRFEARHAKYYGYPYYWAGPGIWGPGSVPVQVAAAVPGSEPLPEGPAADAVHLHSVDEVSGYHIQALDGRIGHVDDFLMDDQTWTIRYLVTDTSNWIGGRTVLVAPEWVRRVDWPQQLVHVDLTRDSIKNGPELDLSGELTREDEERLHRYHDRRINRRR